MCEPGLRGEAEARGVWRFLTEGGQDGTQGSPSFLDMGGRSRGRENVPDKTLLKIPVIVVLFEPQ